MNNSRIQAKAQIIDVKAKKDKILYAGAALLVGLLALVAFAPKAHAQSMPVQSEIKLPFELKSQKLSQ